MSLEPLKVTAIGHGPQLVAGGPVESVCTRLAAWADAARVSSPECGEGSLGIWKSDLLNRLMYAGEMPSQTPCPVHKGKWSGCHSGWPGSTWVKIDAKSGERRETPMDVEPRLQEWWDAGCRCATHRGSSCTTGWNPDEACGCLLFSKSGGSGGEAR